MSSFDTAILGVFNAWANRSWGVDHLIVFIESNELLKGGMVIALLWWAWFMPGREERVRKLRKCLVTGLVGMLGAMLISRILQHSLPFRPRPLHNPALRFLAPGGIAPDTLVVSSSFPSDHAALFFALVAALLLISAALGSVALVYVLLVIAFPRVYLGLHYPTDMLAGAIIGVACVVAAHRLLIKTPVPDMVLWWSERHSASFYAVAFLFSFEMGTLFNSVRSLLEFGSRLLHLKISFR